MMQPSAEQPRPRYVERRLGRDDHSQSGDILPLWSLLLVSGAILWWLATTSARPYGDSGGYEAMLRHFLTTGRVDYMKWSQPTFVGLLPIAVPWAWAFDASTESLQWLSVAFSIALLCGVWAFCERTVGGWAAFWIALGVLLLHEALSSSTSFMTDVPYAAYLVGFLLAHRELEERYAAGRFIGGLWIAWGAMFLLSALTRSFSLVLVPVFLVQWLLLRRRAEHNGFAITCVLLGLVLAVVSVLIVRRLGDNGFSPREITAIPLILDGDRGRLNMRALLAGVLGLAVATLPALLLWSPRSESNREPAPGRTRMSWHGVTPWDAAIGTAALAVSFLFWRKNTLASIAPFPHLEGVERLIQGAQVALAVVAAPLLARVLARGVKAALGARPQSFGVHGEEVPPVVAHTSGVLCAIALVHMALMPILLHPLPRHLMPAGVAVLLLVALQSTWPGAMSRGSRLKATAGGLLLLGLLPAVVLGLASQRALSQKQYDVAAQLNQRGVPVSRIAGGWAFFCARDLRPGLPPKAYLPPNDYVSRYTRREQSAPYLVTTNQSARGQKLSAHSVPVPLLPLPRAQNVRALRRAAAPIRQAVKRQPTRQSLNVARVKKAAGAGR